VTAPENGTYACIGALVDELVRGGVGHLCLCPGSRSAPVALSAARHPGMRVWTLIDERSAAFFALGMAKGLRGPVALLSTSGTAAANFFPALIEARYGRVPLVILTADRPRELRDCGAPQTIDQVRLYGDHVKWFVDVAPPEATDDMLRYSRALACQAVATARERPAGPVHLNVPLREPLVPIPTPDEMPPIDRRAAGAWEGRPGTRPYTVAHLSVGAPDPGSVCELAEDLSRTARGVIICGPHDDATLPPAVCRLATVLGYPILADPLSQVRFGPHDRSLVVDSYDALLRVDDTADMLVADVALCFGGLPASRPLFRYLQRHAGSRLVVVDGDHGWTDPSRLASDVIHADARRLCESLAATVRPGAGTPASPWAALWMRLGEVARRAIRQRLDVLTEPFEGKALSELCGLLPDGATLYVGNSMPVRDLDTFTPGSPKTIRVLGNRGASGIDGLVSSALGTAAAGDGPVILVLGDLAFYHDMNGLLAARRHRLSATIVLLNNDGGGIFSFLPQAAYPEHFEALFGTPTGLDFRLAAELYGATFSRAPTWETFRTRVEEYLASPGLHILEVQTSRDRNVSLHREIWAAVEDAVRAELPHAVPKGPA
jgi:2-succinyl-5-enolpyruvyl-6-hydroxy-3-cyclohexene-1-carboxylate synthase